MMRTMRNLTSLTRPRVLLPPRTAPGGPVRKQEQRKLIRAAQIWPSQIWVGQIRVAPARRPSVRKILAHEISGKMILDKMELAPVILTSRTPAQASLTGKASTGAARAHQTRASRKVRLPATGRHFVIFALHGKVPGVTCRASICCAA